MVIANAVKQLQGHKRMHVWIGGREYRRLSPRDIDTSDGEKKWRLHHILGQVPYLIPGTSVTLADAHGPDGFDILRFPLFPDFYNPNLSEKVLRDAYTSLYSMQYLRNFQSSNVDLLPFCAPNVRPAGREIEIPSRTITITLRTSKFNTELNSQLDEWAKFGSYVQSKGFSVVIIPDFEDLMMDGVVYEKFPRQIVHEPAAFSLFIRTKIYESAQHNFGVSNGVMSVLWFSKNHYSIWFRTSENIKSASVGFLKAFHNLIYGESPKFAIKNQHWLWSPDTFESLKNHFDSLELN
jgi:hypothetical protein